MPERDAAGRSAVLRAGHKVEIAVPAARREARDRGARRLHNAREQLGPPPGRKAPASAQLLEGVAETFGLDAPPQRIEVYDNSHIQGANAVGAMIVAGPEGFEKARVPQVQHQVRGSHARRRLSP